MDILQWKISGEINVERSGAMGMMFKQSTWPNWCQTSIRVRNWVVVSNIFYFYPYLGKIPILTNIFQRGWNHQLGKSFSPNCNITSEVRFFAWEGALLCDPPYVRFCFHDCCPCFLMKPYFVYRIFCWSKMAASWLCQIWFVAFLFFQAQELMILCGLGFNRQPPNRNVLQLKPCNP